MLHDWYRLGINGQSGTYRISFPGTSAAPGNADRIRFADVGAYSDFDNGWKTAANIDQHYAFYGQDRWAPTNRLSITAGLRIDYQDLSYTDGHRKPVVSTATTAAQVGDGGRIFPVETNVTGASLLTNTDLAPRIGVSYSLDRKGRASSRRFTDAITTTSPTARRDPGGTNYIEYGFNDANKNGKSTASANWARTHASAVPMRRSTRT
jgi:hypothetical protein